MFYSFDFNLDPMTLKLKQGLDMVKMYLHTKNENSSYSSSQILPEQTEIVSKKNIE